MRQSNRQSLRRLGSSTDPIKEKNMKTQTDLHSVAVSCCCAACSCCAAPAAAPRRLRTDGARAANSRPRSSRRQRPVEPTQPRRPSQLQRPPAEAEPCLIVGALYGGPMNDAGYNQAMHESMVDDDQEHRLRQAHRGRECARRSRRQDDHGEHDPAGRKADLRHRLQPPESGLRAGQDAQGCDLRARRRLDDGRQLRQLLRRSAEWLVRDGCGGRA